MWCLLEDDGALLVFKNLPVDGGGARETMLGDDEAPESVIKPPVEKPVTRGKLGPPSL